MARPPVEIVGYKPIQSSSKFLTNAASSTINNDSASDRPASSLVGIAFICGVYVSGEELSWGQHIFEWGTPEYWENLNDQGETNFHNTSSWLDQKPRLLLEIGVLIGGIIIPTLQYFKVKMPEKFNLIYPDPKVFVTSIIALFINIADKIDEAMKDVSIMERPSEVEEVYLFYFVLLYLIYFKKRLMQGV